MSKSVFIFITGHVLVHVQSVKKKEKEKKRKTLIHFNTNESSEMKLIPINVDYCLLQFEALNFFLEVRLHGGRVST